MTTVDQAASPQSTNTTNRIISGAGRVALWTMSGMGVGYASATVLNAGDPYAGAFFGSVFGAVYGIAMEIFSAMLGRTPGDLTCTCYGVVSVILATTLSTGILALVGVSLSLKTVAILTAALLVTFVVLGCVALCCCFGAQTSQMRATSQP